LRGETHHKLPNQQFSWWVSFFVSAEVAMSFEVVSYSESFLESLRDAIHAVALEKIYFDMIEAPPLEKLRNFMSGLMEKGAPCYLAISDQKVIGWCDISPEPSPRRSHRGKLTIGVVPEFRGNRVGSSLLRHAADHAKRNGIQKLELVVFSQNDPAISLYHQCGFETEGLIRDYRRLDGVSYDALMMGKFIS
jgi:RimJ/RimL family protein N-acetyltransferase